jgi:hypothetical protein
MDRIRFDDFDWAGTSTNEPPGSSVPPPIPDEAPPPPSPPQTSGRRGEEAAPEYSEDLPPAYREYGAKNVYKRPKRAAGSVAKFDDFDWTGGKTGAPAAPADDGSWAIPRGFRIAEQGGKKSILSSFELARISALPPEQQAAEMLKWGNQPREPGEEQLHVGGIEDIDWSPSKFLTWVGESMGSMAGSMVAAGEYGGLPGAAVGAGIGGLAGATAGGVGAAPRVAGGVAGFTSARWLLTRAWVSAASRRPDARRGCAEGPEGRHHRHQLADPADHGWWSGDRRARCAAGDQGCRPDRWQGSSWPPQDDTQEGDP